MAICDYEEFDENTPHNRVVRAAAVIVARHAALPKGLRGRAQSVARELENVGPVSPLDMRAYIDRATMHYREVLFFAKALLSGAGLALESGGGVAHSFLVRTPELVEAGLRRIIAEDLAGQHHVEKRGKRADVGEAIFTPDIVIDGQAIADVKYRLFRGDWSRADLNQAIAFAAAFRARQAAVFGFVSSERDHLPQGISVSGHSVRPIAWLASTEINPSDARTRFTSEVRQWLDDN